MILSWLAYWPTVAVVLGAVPVLLITRAGAGTGLIAAWTVLATAITTQRVAQQAAP